MIPSTDGSGMCSDRNPYDCAERNPCSSAAYKSGQYYFIDVDPTQFVQCSDTGDCFELPVPPGMNADAFVTMTMQHPGM
jgi:hypothetical protein